MTEPLFPVPEDPRRLVHERLFLGSAGWSYDDWDGPFYPARTSSYDRLTRYAERFRTVEIDSTFYGIPTMQAVHRWYERTPDDFVFSAKFPASITHEARLRNCGEETYRFIETMQELGEKLGPLLIQLGPDFAVNRMNDLALFMEGLPDGLMYAVEIRHRSWLNEEFADLLKRWNVALCLPSAGRLDRFWRVTSRFVYIRWLGRQNVLDRFDHVQIDRTEDLEWWVPRIRHFVDYGGRVFGYVNNNYAGHSPETLRTLADMLAAEFAPADADDGEE